MFEVEIPQTDHPLSTLWKEIDKRVVDIARQNVPYRVDEDPWYGPNAAVWSAAFTASLIGCTLFKYGSLPVIANTTSQWTLANEWSWYQAGHWPCMYYWHCTLYALYNFTFTDELSVYVRNLQLSKRIHFEKSPWNWIAKHNC